MIDTKFEQAFETIPGNGWLSKEEARLLWETALPLTGEILEVGCYKGRSTCLLAQFGRHVYCVDPFEGFSDSEPWEAIRKEFGDNIDGRGIKNISLFQMKIEEWTPRPIGLAYLDGDHTSEGTRSQIKKALLCMPDAIAIHDYSNSGGGLLVKTAAVDMLDYPTRIVETMAVWKGRYGNER